MKRTLMFLGLLAVVFVCFSGVAFSQTIENELYLITPVSKDVHDPALKAFAQWAKKRWNVDVKTSTGGGGCTASLQGGTGERETGVQAESAGEARMRIRL